MIRDCGLVEDFRVEGPRTLSRAEMYAWFRAMTTSNSAREMEVAENSLREGIAFRRATTV
jgi:hypothetical protein